MFGVFNRRRGMRQRYHSVMTGISPTDGAAETNLSGPRQRWDVFETLCGARIRARDAAWAAGLSAAARLALAVDRSQGNCREVVGHHHGVPQQAGIPTRRRRDGDRNPTRMTRLCPACQIAQRHDVDVLRQGVATVAGIHDMQAAPWDATTGGAARLFDQRPTVTLHALAEVPLGVLSFHCARCVRHSTEDGRQADERLRISRLVRQ